jgi:hypothetical protein
LLPPERSREISASVITRRRSEILGALIFPLWIKRQTVRSDRFSVRAASLMLCALFGASGLLPKFVIVSLWLARLRRQEPKKSLVNLEQFKSRS